MMERQPSLKQPLTPFTSLRAGMEADLRRLETRRDASTTPEERADYESLVRQLEAVIAGWDALQEATCG
jgi:hypothetical protein